jgi:aspartate kinase
VSLGEFLSTSILSTYARECGIDNTLIDARQFIFTDDAWTEGKILWDKTEKTIVSAMASFQQQKVVIVQGFIGQAPDGNITTLGREGSDYTASVFAYALQADKMTIWKDVKGVMNADPKEFPEAVWIPELTYHEAIEMTYYGAKVIHPKTIQPIQNRNIPLEVRSFIDFRVKGTMVMSNANTLFMPPVIVFKPKQVLLSFSTKDFSFIAEEHLREIFGEFAGLRLHMNMMQNAAISFSVCVDDKTEKINRITDSLEKRFVISRFENLQLLTVRHYHEPLIRKLTDGKEVLLEQISRNNWQILMRS